MNWDQNGREQAMRERRLQDVARENERNRSDVAQQDDGEDWPLLTFLLGGLALALIANTFVGLMPV